MSRSKTRRSHDIFLSYAVEDAEIASGIAKHLLSIGARVWHDTAAVKAGDSIRNKIEDGIESSKWVGLLFSTSSINKLQARKGYLRFEEYLASVEQDLSDVTRVLPLFVDSTLRPEDLPLKYRDRRAINLSPGAYSKGFSELLTALGHRSLPTKFQNPKDGSTLCLVRGGTYSHGGPESATLHVVSNFYIASRPTSNEQYKKYMEAVSARPPSTWEGNPVVPPLSEVAWWNKPEAGASGLSFPEASSYAAWAGLRLPTAFEFEYVTLKAIPDGLAQIDDWGGRGFEWTSTTGVEFKHAGSDSIMAMNTNLEMSRNFQLPAQPDIRLADFMFRCAAEVSFVNEPLYMPAAWRSIAQNQ